MLWRPSEDDPEDQGSPGGGWIPPETRSWRHPSELHAAGVAAVFTATHGWRRSAALLVGTTALLAIVAGALLLVNTGSSTMPATLDTMPVGTAAVTACCTLSPLLARDAVQAVVSIEPSVGPGATGCGVVVANDLVATTLSAMAGARSVRVVAATGRLLGGQLLAVDPGSGVVVLRLSAPLPAAQMAVSDTLGRGAPALAVTMRPMAGGRAPKPLWTSAQVVSVGEPPPGQPATAMAQITVRGSSVPVMPGEPLVDRQGRVEGILDSASGPDRSFLPMSLVMGVSNDLVTIGRVRHGWLGLTDATADAGTKSSATPSGATADTPSDATADKPSDTTGAKAGTTPSAATADQPSDATGAKVVWVDPGGAAARTLRAGDVILRIDGWRVHSAADLRSMLYVMAPGTKVAVIARRGTRVIRTVVELAPSP